MFDNLALWFAWSFALVIVVLSSVRTFQHWRDPGYWERAEGFERYSILGASFLRALQRGAPSGALGTAVVLLVLTLSAVVGPNGATVLKICSLVVLLVVIANFWSVLLLNRPRFLVPPSLRDEIGPLVAWFRRAKDGSEKGRKGK